jgi:hypothetical protein
MMGIRTDFVAAVSTRPVRAFLIFLRAGYHQQGSYSVIKRQQKHERGNALPLWTALFIFLFALSYLFILQPRYEAPIEDIVTDENAYEITAEDSYIVKHKDGSYSLVTGDGEESPL